ncbi:MAG: N-acetylmuramoyl-L-alanine amidase [Hyphomicrobiaceae bacterium]
MSSGNSPIEEQFVFLVNELRLAEEALANAQAAESSGSSGPDRTYDEVDVDRQRRHAEAVRGEIEALKRNNADALSDLARLEARGMSGDVDLHAAEQADASGRAGALAVVIGHSPQGDMGNNGSVPPFPADPRTARTEYYWNRDLAERIKSAGVERGFDVEVFHRRKSGAQHIPEAYDLVRAWQPEATLEIHFNGFHLPRQGTETLYLKGNRVSEKWAQALQNQMVALYGRKKSDNSDRGLKPRTTGENGAISLRQIHPCALIEPFFGDSPVDALLGIQKKQALAAAVVDAFAAHSTHRPASAAAPASGGDEAAAESVSATREFGELQKVYAATSIDFPVLRDITFAQWAHESDFGRSELARNHKNYAGMKWLDAMAPLAKRVKYRPAHDPDGRDYCGFETPAKFIAGYWHRLDLPSLPYSTRRGGWRRHAQTADMFIDFIGPIWAPRGGTNSPFNTGYEKKVRRRLEQLRAAGLLPSQVHVA